MVGPSPNQRFQEARRTLLARVAAMLHSPAAPKLVVLDDNAYYASMRQEAYQVARAGMRASG